jgi:predicted O-methyltransferase YrrM
MLIGIWIMRIEQPREKYANQLFGLTDQELVEVKSEMDKHRLAFMSISPAEGRILQFLMRGFGVKKVVEVGTLFGYSTLCMSQALPADGKIITLEKNPEHHATAARTFAKVKAGSKIEALCGDATELLSSIEKQGPFDLVFIDADKNGYGRYLDWAERNVRKGGLIVGDNTFLFGAFWGPAEDRDIGPEQIKIMTEFNSRLADSSKYNSVIVPTHQGMTVAQKL